MSTDRNLKKCCTSSRLLRPYSVDRLSSLPDELLSRVLSLLPTKDAAVTQVLSKRMKQAFRTLTSVDLDDSPVSHCKRNTHLVERFPLFKSFSDNVLRKLSHVDEPLTRFRLRVGTDRTTLYLLCSKGHYCTQACFPYVEPSRLYRWISYPLSHCGLRELDLSFHVKNWDECKLPSTIFTSSSLEVLRLASNLEIGGGGADIPVIVLPKLKLLHLHSLFFTEDDFVTRLVSSCLSLEHLSITCCTWVKSDYLSISSHSLRTLILDINKYDEEKNNDLVHIDTPNLQYLDYTDNLSRCYSVSHMKALVEASITVKGCLEDDIEEGSFCSQLSLLKALADVQHLSLQGTSPELMYYAGEMKDQLPVFHNLKTLELGALNNATWDIVVLLILHRSPLLETLHFSEGLFVDTYCKHITPIPVDLQYDPFPSYLEIAAREAEGWETTGIIPSCFLTHLKRIEINWFYGCERELKMVKFLLSKASVLKEFVITLAKEFEAPNIHQFEGTLKELTRASNSCSISVHLGDEPAFMILYKKYISRLI